jgi:hypothetical protein
MSDERTWHWYHQWDVDLRQWGIGVGYDRALNWWGFTLWLGCVSVLVGKERY